MNCINHYTGLGEIPICDEAAILPLTADISGIWAFISSFNGAYQHIQFHQEANQNIVIPATLNEDYTYIFRLYKPDGSIFNDTYYCMHTIAYVGGALNMCNESGEVLHQLQTGKLQFTAIDSQDMVSYIELAKAKQVIVFIEGAIRQEGTQAEDYLFDAINGIVSFNTPLTHGQKITILYFK